MVSNVPIFIISFNRPTALRTLIAKLVEMKQERIIIVDNCSTYEPLLQYYSEIQDSFEIIHMPTNHGCHVIRKLWKDGKFVKKYGLKTTNFIYTDCDVVPECPSDFAEKFNMILDKYGTITKVGLGIRIDDLPDSFSARGKVIKWESQFWNNEIIDREIGVTLYPAPVDTTFSYQRANTSPEWSEKCFRTGKPYIAKHLPWYIDDSKLSEEDQYYIETARPRETHFPGRYFMWYKT